MQRFSGLGVNLGNLWRLSEAESRAITPENPTGGKGQAARDVPGEGHPAAHLGVGWKVTPRVLIGPGETLEIADVAGSGAIQHIWMTPTRLWRLAILRIYWDGQEHPSVECPLGDFFCSGRNSFAQLTSAAVCVNPGAAFNCYWEMPFRRRCRMTVTNLHWEAMSLYYQIDYTLTEVPEDAAYFHAQFRRVNPAPFNAPFTVLDGIHGAGQYVGTYMFWSIHDTGWWGEGEVKFYIDGDTDYPTICGTGTEDYFCGSYDFNPGNPYLRSGKPEAYTEFSTPYAGLHQIIRPDGLYNSQTQFGLYRWHIPDPVRFKTDIRVTCQCLGWSLDRRYLPRQDDIASVAYWYQTLPGQPFPELPDRDRLMPSADV